MIEIVKALRDFVRDKKKIALKALNYAKLGVRSFSSGMAAMLILVKTSQVR